MLAAQMMERDNRDDVRARAAKVVDAVSHVLTDIDLPVWVRNLVDDLPATLFHRTAPFCGRTVKLTSRGGRCR
jgi:hypothetical protein